MSLHDQYQELLRRGMPEHPRLRTTAGKFMFYHVEISAWGERNSDWAELGESDARDLIEAHALRWLPKVLDYPWWGNGVSDERGEFFVRWGRDPQGFNGVYGKSFLEVALLATEGVKS